ncbi:hypothetical protein NE237_028774 [Protea cynaroides]|uniref:Uncharacterized protein n=1 Tax=Protea cynaroides TaxID=273540 RepID=A0A9Q0GTY5_9MAGN|nr:hypothetical protein NE237_028774 [Protea cynaroides]
MELKLRGDEDKASTYFSSSGSSDGYSTDQALRALRELEKERIRDEIITAERRALELEVRRELLLERELAVQRMIHSHVPSLMGSTLSVLSADQKLSLMPHLEGSSSLDESLGFPTLTEVGMRQPEGPMLEERLSLPPEVGVLEKLPLQRSPESSVVDVKPLSEESKGQALFFVKPTSSSLAGMKRKVVETPPAAIAGVAALLSVGSKKKPREWNCALCQVCATSQKGLDDHLLGRKHKLREAALVAGKTISKKTGGSTSSTKNTDQLTKTADITGSPKSNQGKRRRGNKKQPVKQNGDAPVQEKQKTEDLKNKTGEVLEQKKQKYEALKKKFEFLCEMCQVGAHSWKVMASHQKGKKHLYWLEKLKKDEANREMENVDGEVDRVEEADKQDAGQATEVSSAVDMVARSKEARDDNSGPSSVAVVVEGHRN